MEKTQCTGLERPGEAGALAERAPTERSEHVYAICYGEGPAGKSEGQINGNKGQLMEEIGNGVKGSSGGLTLRINVNT